MKQQPFVVLATRQSLGDNKFIITPESIHKQVIGYLKENLPNHTFEVAHKSPFAFVVEPKADVSGEGVMSINFIDKDSEFLTIKSISKNFYETTFKYLQQISSQASTETFNVIPCEGYLLILNYRQLNRYMKVIINSLEDIIANAEFEKLPKEQQSLHYAPLPDLPEA
jgi:hypothetical protein